MLLTLSVMLQSMSLSPLIAFGDNKTYTLKIDPNGGVYRGSTGITEYTWESWHDEGTLFEWVGPKLQYYTTPVGGYYFLELWGAKGGDDSGPGGYGGYVKSYTRLNQGQVLYIACGEQGETQHGNEIKVHDPINGVSIDNPIYGGGARAGILEAIPQAFSGQGGGATSIYLSAQGNGDLINYVGCKNDVLAVAGGGGGGSEYIAGGGGVVLYGGSGYNYSVINSANEASLNMQFAQGSYPGEWNVIDGGGGGGGWIGGVHGIDSHIDGKRASGGGASFVNTSCGCYNSELTPGVNGGAGKVKITLAESANPTILETPTRTGYNFNGWKITEGTGNIYKNYSQYLVQYNSDMTVEAQWTPITYTVTYDSNKPNDASTSIEGTTPDSKHVYDTKSNLSPNGYKLRGYIFTGWNTEKDGTGTHYDDEAEVLNLTTIDNDVITLYAQWIPIEYKIYYDKGLTTDITTTSIANADRNTDIQLTLTDRPYTQCVFDSDVSLATIGSLKGREYILEFDSNKPESIIHQKENKDAVPTSVSKITGKLESLGKYQITEQDADITENLIPNIGATLTRPNYVSVQDDNVTATALWKDITLNNFNSPTLTGWEFVGWYDNQLGSPSETKTYDTDKYKQTASGKVISETVYPSTAKFNKTLYARWKRTIHLTFDMNGGFYQGDSKDVTLTGIYYNNADGYDFSLTSTPTPESLPNYEKQQGVIDAYGSYNMDDEYGKNGENQKYVKTDAEGITYRFLGWSLDKNATEPDNRFISFLESHQKDFRIYDDTTLYAVWEPVLITNITLKRTLGDLKFNNGDTPLSNVQNVRASSENKNVEVIAKPGEQCNYIIATKGRKEIQAKVIFDSKITDIYTNNGIWTDNLNPNTKTGEELSESHGLDRLIKLGTINSVMKKFYIPQYLGTSQSFESSIGKTQYQMIFSIEQDSYFYKLVYDDKEKAEIYGTIYITTYKSGDGTDETPVNPSEPITSVLDELRAKLKIRLK